MKQIKFLSILLHCSNCDIHGIQQRGQSVRSRKHRQRKYNTRYCRHHIQRGRQITIYSPATEHTKEIIAAQCARSLFFHNRHTSQT